MLFDSAEFAISKIWKRLYLGNFSGASNLVYGNLQSIDFVVNCTPDVINYETYVDGYGQVKKTKHPVQCLVLDFHDGNPIPEDKFWAGINAIQKALFEGKTILVHCHAGISRSPAMVAAYLYLTGFDEFDQCLDFVRSKRSIVQPHPLVIKSIKQHLKIWPYSKDAFYQP